MPEMCMFDVVFTAPFGAGGLMACCRALEQAGNPLQKLHLWVCGPLATADSEGLLAAGFGGVHTLAIQQKGWAAQCGQGAVAGQAPWVVFLHPGAQVQPGFFDVLAQAGQQEDVAALECRQLPCEASHHVDPVTLECPWVGGPAFAVRRSALCQAGGFDKRLPQEAAAADLSWRLRAAGGRLRYVPGAVVRVQPQEADGTLPYYAAELYGRLLLSCKYGRAFSGNREYLSAIRRPRHYEGVRRVLTKAYLSYLKPGVLLPMLFWRWKHPLAAYRDICDFSGGYAPQRGVQVLPPLTRRPLVSVVVRTMGRPQVLRGALQSLRNQTYRDFEVIVAEDGPPTAQGVVEEFGDLTIRYHCMGRVTGRGANGNAGLALAKGEYVNFLDDDDFFYPDHLEWMVAAALEQPEQPVILGTAMAMEADVVCSDPYRLDIKRISPMHFDRFDLLKMSKICLIPIQSALFKRSLYEQYGGLKEGVDGNEDWAMWLKFLGRAPRPWVGAFDITRATSIFTVPANAQAEAQRVEKYRAYYNEMLRDEDLVFTVTLQDLHDMYNAMLRDVQHLQTLGRLEEHVNEQLKF